MKKLLFLFVLSLFVIPLFSTAQNMTTQGAYQKEWAQVDSLKKAGLPRSAVKVIKQIQDKAEQAGDTPNLIKAKLYLFVTEDDYQDKTQQATLKEMLKLTESSNGLEQALWKSITAELLWSYYQQNRWTILERTAVAGNETQDYETWTAADFFARISILHLEALKEPAMLQKTPVEAFDALLIEGVNTRHLRPSLYDLLAHRALQFFARDEKDLVRPAYSFQLREDFFFEPAAAFAQRDLSDITWDTVSLHLKSLEIYQELIQFHLKDENPAAFIDLDLSRLKFIYENSVHPLKDSLYLEGLTQLEQRYPSRPEVAMVSYEIALCLMNHNFPAAFEHSMAEDTTGRDLLAAKSKLEAIIAKFPKSEGGVHAFNALQQLTRPDLALEAEQGYLPGAAVKLLLKYRNTDKVVFKLYRIKHQLPDQRAQDMPDREALEKMSSLRSWSLALPASGDLEKHATEIKVESLESGQYVLVADIANPDSDTFSLGAAVRFQVSGLSLVKLDATNRNATLFVLHRKSGLPIEAAQVLLWKREWNNKVRRSVYQLAHQYTTDKQGRVQTAGNEHYDAVYLVSGTDTFQQSGFSVYRHTVSTSAQESRIFLFTDRRLYRPGQTIYFKGIQVKRVNQSGRNQVEADVPVTLNFYDANGQLIEKKELKTNAFGSFSGELLAPEGGLTGRMRLDAGLGSVSVSVEEYKRPRFFVELDSLKGEYHLNQPVRIKGRAEAYAGSRVDGAEYTYRVLRTIQFPCYWASYRWGGYFPRQQTEMEVANGSGQTAADGSFEIEFETLPDPKVDPRSLPVFTYRIYIDVTDINGETRSGKESLRAGYHSLQIVASVDQQSRINELDTLRVSSQNLNGLFVPTELQVSIAPLKFPGKIYKKRLWESPDQHVMTEAEFRAAFPDDEYKHEGDYREWEAESVTFKESFRTTATGVISIPRRAWENGGWHVITLTGKDARGNALEEKRFTYVVDADLSDHQLPLVAYSKAKSYQPGDQGGMTVISGFPKGYLLEAGTLSPEAVQGIDIASRSHRIARKLSESERGGVRFSWLLVQNNRVYTLSADWDVPWPEKDLALEWATHRDKLKPGEEETWTLTIKGDKKEQLASELLAGMYDASLDAFAPHNWSWDKLQPYKYGYVNWNAFGFEKSGSRHLRAIRQEFLNYAKSYDRLDIPYRSFYLYSGGRYPIRRAASPNARDDAQYMSVQEIAADAAPAPEAEKVEEKESAKQISESDQAVEDQTEGLRTNLEETAFFFPHLQTDSAGNIKFSFTIPEALTTWKFMAFAHNKTWETGYLEGEVRTQKELMVTPNLPRFFRQKDSLWLSAKITNLSEQELDGEATLEILDAFTLQPLNTAFRVSKKNPTFRTDPGKSTTTTWIIKVPESRYRPIIVRIKAKAGSFTDGEESALPVISNRMLVTETLPLPVRGAGAKSFSLEKLLNNRSNSLVHQGLTVTYTGNPAWYAVQALPYLMEYPHECAEQLFNRFYANALAGHIVAGSPRIKAVFSQWETLDTDALLSNLEKNQELKSALLQETPWLREAESENAQKQRIALLFQNHKLSKELSRNLRKLEQMQLAEGSFCWFKGMQPNRYITQYIISGLARLQHLQVSHAESRRADKIIERALPYLDRSIAADYKALLERGADLEKPQISYLQIQYLYLRSLFPDNKPDDPKAVEYYRAQAAKYWNNFNPFMKGMIALALNRYGDSVSAGKILASLKETAVHSEEMGMYWEQTIPGYWWYQASISAQAQLIETFTELEQESELIDDMKTWLIKQKQTQHWNNTVSTADAVYALLLNGENWLVEEPQVAIHLGDTLIRSTDIRSEAGTGYFKYRIPGASVKPEMGDIRVQVSRTDGNKQAPSWGAVYWQYFEDLDKIRAAATPLSLEKEIYRVENTDRGPVLKAFTRDEPLKVGDRVRVRIILRSDRDMEYLHLKDLRAACFEPENVLSGYRFQAGLGYYESTLDVSSNFFMDYLPKGTHVFEYTAFVSQAGSFSGGVTSIQCMYAPEFSSHSEGERIRVQ